MNLNYLSKKVKLFLALTFCISWIPFILFNALSNDGLNMSTFLLWLIYIPAPAYATIIVKRMYNESIRSFGLSLRAISRKWLLNTTLFFLVFVYLSFGTVILFGNIMDIAEFGKLDFSKTHFFENFTNLSGGVAFNTDILDISDLGLFNSLIISSIFLGFSFYLILALGTELGWRGFLTDETKEMGYVNSNVFVGTVWGIWSIPLVLTGLEFTDHQLGGALINIVFCILLSFILSYCRFKTKSILGPASLYGMFYSIQGLYILYNNDGNPVFASIKGVAGLIVLSLAIYLIFKLDPKFIFYYGREQEAPPEENHEKLE